MQTLYMIKEEDAIESYYVVEDYFALFTAEKDADEVAAALNAKASGYGATYKVVPVVPYTSPRTDEVWYNVKIRLSSTGEVVESSYEETLIPAVETYEKGKESIMTRIDGFSTRKLELLVSIHTMNPDPEASLALAKEEFSMIVPDPSNGDTALHAEQLRRQRPLY